mgnify:CR=1 FL=1
MNEEQTCRACRWWRRGVRGRGTCANIEVGYPDDDCTIQFDVMSECPDDLCLNTAAHFGCTMWEARRRPA